MRRCPVTSTLRGPTTRVSPSTTFAGVTSTLLSDPSVLESWIFGCSALKSLSVRWCQSSAAWRKSALRSNSVVGNKPDPGELGHFHVGDRDKDVRCISRQSRRRFDVQASRRSLSKARKKCQGRPRCLVPGTPKRHPNRRSDCNSPPVAELNARYSAWVGLGHPASPCQRREDRLIWEVEVRHTMRLHASCRIRPDLSGQRRCTHWRIINPSSKPNFYNTFTIRSS